MIDKRNSKIMRDRRTLLGALNMIYPGHMPGDELFRVVLGVNPEYTRTFLVKDMTYLNEKGYIAFRGLGGLDAASISVRRCAFRLTANGTDVANRIVTDPTLAV